jgi:FAD synthase
MILRSLANRASEKHLASVVIMFRPRPSEVIGLGPLRPYLSNVDDSEELVRALGIRHVGIVQFSKNLALLTAPRFLSSLAKRIPVAELWMGPDALVGRGPEGRFEAVREYSKTLGIPVFQFPRMKRRGKRLGGSLSNIEVLSSVLGRAYSLPAYVVLKSRSTREPVARAFAVFTPRRLVLPDDGVYWVEVSPLRESRATGPTEGIRKVKGVLVVKTGRYLADFSDISFFCDTASEMPSEPMVRLTFLGSVEPDVSSVLGSLAGSSSRRTELDSIQWTV